MKECKRCQTCEDWNTCLLTRKLSKEELDEENQQLLSLLQRMNLVVNMTRDDV